MNGQRLKIPLKDVHCSPGLFSPPKMSEARHRLTHVLSMALGQNVVPQELDDVGCFVLNLNLQNL